MPERVHPALELLAQLHRASGTSPARRLGALERSLGPLGELLGASAVLMLTRLGRHPLLVRSGCERRARSEAAANRGDAGGWSGSWWARWMAPFAALPTDNVVRRGMLLPHGPHLIARPAGWGRTRMPRAARARRGARPILAQGTRLEQTPLRLILLREPGQAAFSEQDARLLAAIVEHLVIVDKNARQIERLRRATVTDDLTRIYNYRYLKRALRAALQALRRRGGTLSVLMVDVDNLREYNNLFGHLAASKVLARIGELLRRSLGRRGWVAKYGGDEFLIVLPQTGRNDAHAVAERLRGIVAAAKVGDADFGGITCSFGVASAPKDGDTYVGVLEAADRALFQAKAQGRNTVVDAAQDGESDRPARGDLAA